jgi:hypothetical protein
MVPGNSRWSDSPRFAASSVFPVTRRHHHQEEMRRRIRRVHRQKLLVIGECGSGAACQPMAEARHALQQRRQWVQSSALLGGLPGSVVLPRER